MARRVTVDEFLILEKLEYVDGRIMTGPGIEFVVGLKEFHAGEVQATSPSLLSSRPLSAIDSTGTRRGSPAPFRFAS